VLAWRWSPVLGAVRWSSVLFGVGAGSLASAVVGLLVAAATAVLGSGDSSLAGVTGGVVAGLLTAGTVAGRLAPVWARFHGALAGLGLAFVVVLVSIFGGSPAPAAQIIWLGVLGILLGGLAGTVAGRR